MIEGDVRFGYFFELIDFFPLRVSQKVFSAFFSAANPCGRFAHSEFLEHSRVPQQIVGVFQTQDEGAGHSRIFRQEGSLEIKRADFFE